MPRNRKKKLAEDAAARGVSLEDSLDELLVVEMLESEQGRLKVQARVNPQDKLQSNVINLRAKDLTKPESTSKNITGELAKSLTKSGYILPKYGLGVKLRMGSCSAASLASPNRRPSLPSPNHESFLGSHRNAITSTSLESPEKLSQFLLSQSLSP